MSETHVARIVLILAVLFNAVLAVLNARAHSLNAGFVIGCESALTLAAAAIGARGSVPEQRRWIALIGLLAVNGLANGFGSGGFDPKLLRDVLLIPVFVLLGLRCDRGDILKVLLPLQVLVLAVMIFEGLRPEDYGRFFNVISYYINTRGFQAESFWNTGSDLFVSATRPGDRFLFNSLGIHRLSSIFLEPVSLGNHCAIVAIVSAALWPSLTLRQRLFVGVSEGAILIGCDGRFASVTIVLIAMLGLIGSRLPPCVNWLYLPSILAVSALMVSALAIQPVGDDFPGRTAGSLAMVRAMNVADLLGFTTARAYTVMDSGIAYLLYSQSLFGALLVWSFVALGLPQRDRATAVMIHGASLYVALNLMVSYSVFSIKTSALLWFCCGAMLRPARQSLRRATARFAAHGAGFPILPQRSGQPA